MLDRQSVLVPNPILPLCTQSAAADTDMSNIGKSIGWDAEKVRFSLCSPENYDAEAPEKKMRTHLHIHGQAGIHEKIDVLRVKNRFAEPTSGGWADFMVSFRFRSDPNQHVCEVRRSGVL